MRPRKAGQRRGDPAHADARYRPPALAVFCSPHLGTNRRTSGNNRRAISAPALGLPLGKADKCTSSVSFSKLSGSNQPQCQPSPPCSLVRRLISCLQPQPRRQSRRAELAVSKPPLLSHKAGVAGVHTRAAAVVTRHYDGAAKICARPRISPLWAQSEGFKRSRAPSSRKECTLSLTHRSHFLPRFLL